MFLFVGIFDFVYQKLQAEVRTELEHMEDYNQQLSMNLDGMIEAIDSFRYIHFSDNKIRNLLCSDDCDIDSRSHKETEYKLEEYLKLLVDMGQGTQSSHCNRRRKSL